MVLSLWWWCANLFTAIGQAAPASAVVPPGCFSLEKPRVLLGPIPPDGTSQSGSGWGGGKEPTQAGHWAVATRIIPSGLSAIRLRLENPYSVKNPKTQEVTVTKLTPDPALKGLERLEQRHISMHPVFFIHIQWNEEVFFDRLSPKKILMSYQKKDGTSHIRHFCGNISAEEIGPEQSRVVMYEEIEADYRSVDDTLASVRDTLAHLMEADRKDFPALPKQDKP